MKKAIEELQKEITKLVGKKNARYYLSCERKNAYIVEVPTKYEDEVEDLIESSGYNILSNYFFSDQDGGGRSYTIR